MDELSKKNIEQISKNNSKISKILFILGLIFFIVAIIFSVLNMLIIFERFASEVHTLGEAISIVIGLICFFIPGSIFEILSLIFGGVSLKLTRKENNKKNKILFIGSLILFAIYLSEFVLLYI